MKARPWPRAKTQTTKLPGCCGRCQAPHGLALCYPTWDHFFRRAISEMVHGRTPNIFAISRCVCPRSSRYLISSTLLSLSLARGLLSPRRVPRHLCALPLRTMSAVLSARVPKNRCVGLTHARLSQVWHTHAPSGIACRNNAYTRRWTRQFLPPTPIRP